MGYFIALRRRATAIWTSRDNVIYVSRVMNSFQRQLLIVVSSYRYYYLKQTSYDDFLSICWNIRLYFNLSHLTNTRGIMPTHYEQQP